MYYDRFIEFAIIQGGVPDGTVVLMLMLPIVVTIIAFFRQVIGIKAFGIYTPALITFAFAAIGSEAESVWKGALYGVTIFVTVIFIGTIMRYVLKRFRLLYLPRVALLITIVSLSTLALLVVGGMFQRTGGASVSIFPILIMIALVEKFVATQIEKGARTAIILSFETLLISLVCYAVLSWDSLIRFVSIHSWVVLFTIVINIFLGKWTGLRLTEMLRFKDVIKNAEHTDKN